MFVGWLYLVQANLHHNYQNTNISVHLIFHRLPFIYGVVVVVVAKNKFESIALHTKAQMYHHNDDTKPKSDTSFSELVWVSVGVCFRLVADSKTKKKGKTHAAKPNIPKHVLHHTNLQEYSNTVCTMYTLSNQHIFLRKNNV